jgi:arylsulfatase
MDKGIGRVLAKLRETGQAENTLILFLADNGGCHEEKIAGEQPTPPGPADSFTSYGRAWANASNTPFRMYKHWVHEGGIASPLIMHWPAAMRNPNRIDRQPGFITDLMATCLDAAGAAYPREHNGIGITPTEGRSLVPAVRHAKREIRQTVCWEHMGNRAVRHDDWKLVSQRNGAWELYNLAADRCEMKDLAAAEPARVAAMQKIYEEWAVRVGAVPPEQLRRR